MNKEEVLGILKKRTPDLVKENLIYYIKSSLEENDRKEAIKSLNTYNFCFPEEKLALSTFEKSPSYTPKLEDLGIDSDKDEDLDRLNRIIENYDGNPENLEELNQNQKFIINPAYYLKKIYSKPNETLSSNDIFKRLDKGFDIKVELEDFLLYVFSRNSIIVSRPNQNDRYRLKNRI